MQNVVLGEKFPLPQFIQPGDYSGAFLTASGFDVIISLTNITEREEIAIADEEFDIYMVDTDFGPFLVFKFGEELSFDFSLNILKMDRDRIPGWLNDPSSTITIYILEGRDSVVKAVRFVPFEKMAEFKESCRKQVGKTSQEVDFFIHRLYSRFHIADLIENASYHFTVPETLVL